MRLEHRAVPAGPTLLDGFADAALFFGLVQALAGLPVAPETRVGFDRARANFYAAAREGLRAALVWTGGERVSVARLLRDELLALARRGLETLGIAGEDIALCLGVIEGRLRTGRNGAAWQRAFVASHGDDMRALCDAYRERQESGAPVHEWTI